MTLLSKLAQVVCLIRCKTRLADAAQYNQHIFHAPPLCLVDSARRVLNIFTVVLVPYASLNQQQRPAYLFVVPKQNMCTFVFRPTRFICTSSRKSLLLAH